MSGRALNNSWLVGVAVLFAMVAAPSSAIAHPEGFSGLHVKIEPELTHVSLTLHTRDFSNWFPPGKYPDYVADVCREMQATAAEIVELQLNGQPLQPISAKAHSLEVGLIELALEYDVTPPAGAELLVWSKHLIFMPRGHQQLLFIEDRRALTDETELGPLLQDDTLSVERDASAVLVPAATTNNSPEAGPTTATTPTPNTPNATARTSRISFFAFGVEHIITGYDHLLFLAALLLTCTRFKEAAAIITCFTIAHSVTLVLAALDMVRLPAEVVEPAIALSIVYVACENLVGTPSLWRRAGVTCFFGLIHGLGFASALREIGLGRIPGGVIWPLLKFNLGVEAGQLAIAAVLLPLLLAIKRSEQLERRLVPAGSLVVAIAGGYWFVTRIVGQFV